MQNSTSLKKLCAFGSLRVFRCLGPNSHTIQLHGFPCFLTAMSKQIIDLQEVMILFS